ncbi:MAG: hypothetical protein AAFP18_18065 [Bacteroidota bacterium]
MDLPFDTLADIEALAAGPVLDALVAQHALGLAVVWNDKAFAEDGAYAYTGADGKTRVVLPYSTDPLAAEALVHAIRDRRGGRFTLLAFHDGWLALGHTPQTETTGPMGTLEFSRLEVAPTRALAIARCALRVFVLDDRGPTDDEIEDAQAAWAERFD